jgi:hypothetical protein
MSKVKGQKVKLKVKHPKSQLNVKDLKTLDIMTFDIRHVFSC